MLDKSPAVILVDTNDWPGVIRAANDLAADVNRVTGHIPNISYTPKAPGQNAVIIGTVGKSEFIDRLIREKKIDASEIAGKWESFFLQVVPKPFPGIDNALVICGSDKRGTIYGIYDLSEQIGVSPWHYWADVPAKHHDQLFVKAGKFVQGPPSVKYRGIFINDEAPALSGKAVMEHPEAKRMLEDVRRGHITGLIFSKLARLTRNARELMDFSDFFRENNADLISLQENIDTGNPSGRLFYNMVAVMAQWKREEIADRVRASISVRAKLGKPPNGKAPYGYTWKDKKLQPQRDEAPVRRLMYELFDKHGRKKTVARLLNERGLRTRDGSKWSDTSVDRLIRDTTAKGVHRANYTRRVAGNKPWAFKPEHEWILTPVEAVVSEDLWQRCNDNLEARKTKLARPAKHVTHLFAGLVFCQCGKKMYVPSNSPKYVCTGCRNKIPIEDLSAVFVDELKDYLVSSEKVAAYLTSANASIGEKRQLLATMRSEFEKVKQQAEQTYQLYLKNGLTVEQFKEIYQPLDVRKKQIEGDIPRVEAELDILNVDEFSSEQIMAEAGDFHSRWPKMNHDERRKIVELLVKTIIIGQGEITLNLCYLPSFEQMSNGQRNV